MKMCAYVRVILAAIALAISIGVSAYFAYSCWYFKKDVIQIKFWHLYSMELHSNNNLMNAIPLNLLMGKFKQVVFKNRTSFYNYIINIEEFNSSLLKIDKKNVQRY